MKQSGEDTADGHEGTAESGRRRCRCTVPMFTGIVSCVVLFWMIGYAYTTGVVRTLERRFGLSSSQSGLILSSNDIMHVSVVVFVGYFGLRSNKPRLICVTTSISALGNLVMSLPHWMYSSDGPASSHNYNASSTASLSEFCTRSDIVNSTSGSSGAAHCDDVQQTSTTHPALYFFIIARLMNGIGNSGTTVLSVAYIDENTSKTKSPLYIGCVTGMMVLGPVCGLMLASLMLRLPQNIAFDATELQPDDPRWIGCWWLGYIFVAVGILATSVPLWFFPSSLTNRRPSSVKEDGVKAHQTNRQTSIWRKLWKQIKEFVRALLHLFRNVPYVYCAGFKICANIIVVGVLLNAVRYIEIAFHQPAFVASIISALSWSLAGALGSFGGGLIMSRFKLTPVGAVKLIIFATSGFIVGVAIFLFLGCPHINMAGDLDPDDSSFTVYQECNNLCSCSTSRKSYDPVCGSDNVTYFSACFAGCKDLINDTYVGCRCVGATASNSSLPEMTSYGDVTARAGLCLPECSVVIVYAVVIFLATITFSLCMAPDTVVNFRVVNDDERSFALAINSFLGNLIGYIPAPMLFGLIIDSTCRLWERDGDSSACDAGRTGSCLLFDTDQLRWRTYGLSLCVQLLQLGFAVLLYFAIRHRNFDSGDELPSKVKTVVAESKPLSTAEELALLEVNTTQPSDGHADGALR